MTASPHKVRVVGEVVGVFERKSERIAKICLHPYCIEVNMRVLKEPHLGDEVVVVGSLSVDRVVMVNGGAQVDEKRGGLASR